MQKLICNHDGIVVTLNRDESRIDSRIIAQALEIQHDNFIQTLEKHKDTLQGFGIFLFQTGKIQGRGRPEKFAMLNEDQFIFAVTLSHNTPKVVQAKAAIVRAYSTARKLLSAHSDYINAYHDLHDIVQNMEVI